MRIMQGHRSRELAVELQILVQVLSTARKEKTAHATMLRI